MVLCAVEKLIERRFQKVEKIDQSHPLPTQKSVLDRKMTKNVHLLSEVVSYAIGKPMEGQKKLSQRTHLPPPPKLSRKRLMTECLILRTFYLRFLGYFIVFL